MLPSSKECINMIKEAVMFMPPKNDKEGNEIYGKRANTFAYAEDIDSLLASTLQYDSMKDYYAYFNRQRHFAGNTSHSNEANGPVVICFQGTFQIDNYFDANNGYDVDDFKLLVVDISDNQIKGKAMSKHRYPVDIFQDCKDIVAQIFRYIKGCGRYKIDDDVYIWTNLSRIEYLLDKGIISEYEEDYAASEVFRSKMIVRNNDSLGVPIRFGDHGYYGVRFELKMVNQTCMQEPFNYFETENIFGECC